MSKRVEHRRTRPSKDYYGLSRLQWLAAAFMLIVIIGLIVSRSNADQSKAPRGVPGNVTQALIANGCGEHCTETNVQLQQVGPCPLSAADTAAGIKQSFDTIRSSDVRDDSNGQVQNVRTHFTVYQHSGGDWESDAALGGAVCSHL